MEGGRGRSKNGGRARDISAKVHAVLTTHLLAPTAGGQGLRDVFFGGLSSAG